MAFVDVTSEQGATYGTHSHGEEGFATPGGTYPAQLKWSDLHPPGVKVLPKGSAAAGEGEINWENTLGGGFARALERLEGLLYAMFGSRPAAFPRATGGYDKCQWYDRLHPRCLFPEIWERRLILQEGCDESGTCWDYQPMGKEYAALGESPPCCPMPTPSVPIRSRSGDPAAQYATGAHDRTYFPLGSVMRDCAGSFPFDPEGRGWFGATQPGRNDSPAWLKLENGYIWKDGQAVTISWTKPGGVQTPTSVTLLYQLKLPGAGWGTWQSAAMTPDGDTYEAELAAQPHGTECRWYLRYFYDDPDPQQPDITRYDPGGDEAPEADHAYSFVWFTHFNPYAYGLPEMLASYGGVDVRHGTDHYQFDGSETVQYGLINMARWVLSWLGGDCCTGEYETCAETDYRSDVIHFNPRTRGGEDDAAGICCLPMPVRFRWSGSNQHPHYMTGGKAGPLDTAPLHSRDDDGGSPAARKTWRGINMLYADEPFYNPFYGGGYSWGTAPGTFTLLYAPGWDELARVWAKYPAWGLRPGDVIEAVHIREIIDAVDFLISNGAWTTANICTRKRTPGTYMGHTCGHHYALNHIGAEFGEERIYGCEKCCANFYEGCPGSSDALGWWNHIWGSGYDEEYTYVPMNCDPWGVPEWGDCMDDCQNAKCHMMSVKVGIGLAGGWPPCKRHWSHETVCDGYFPGEYGPDAPGCGLHRDERGCYEWNPYTEEWVESPHNGRGCMRRVEGFSYYACTPDSCINGWDDNHGGQYVKHRVDHSWPHNIVPTGPVGGEAAGNCLADIFACGTVYPLGGATEMGFHDVAGVYWPGLVTSWYGGCDGMPECSTECPWPLGEVLALPGPVPGYGYHDENGNPFCSVYYHSQTGCFSAYQGLAACDGHVCLCTLGAFPVCQGQAAWVAVDLNLNADNVPVLRDYDLTKNAATWSHDCPCETWTGVALCGV